MCFSLFFCVFFFFFFFDRRFPSPQRHPTRGDLLYPRQRKNAHFPSFPPYPPYPPSPSRSPELFFLGLISTFQPSCDDHLRPLIFFFLSFVLPFPPSNKLLRRHNTYLFTYLQRVSLTDALSQKVSKLLPSILLRPNTAFSISPSRSCFSPPFGPLKANHNSINPFLRLHINKRRLPSIAFGMATLLTCLSTSENLVSYLRNNYFFVLLPHPACFRRRETTCFSFFFLTTHSRSSESWTIYAQTSLPPISLISSFV